MQPSVSASCVEASATQVWGSFPQGLLLACATAGHHCDQSASQEQSRQSSIRRCPEIFMGAFSIQYSFLDLA